jgi:hypothetical protein
MRGMFAWVSGWGGEAKDPPPSTADPTSSDPYPRAPAHVGQPVFTAALNTSVSAVHKWEVGDKKASGPSLKLLNRVAQGVGRGHMTRSYPSRPMLGQSIRRAQCPPSVHDQPSAGGAPVTAPARQLPPSVIGCLKPTPSGRRLTADERPFTDILRTQGNPNHEHRPVWPMLDDGGHEPVRDLAEVV